MKLPDVSGVYDYAGPTRDSRYRPPPFCLPPTQKRQRPDCIFSELNTQPACTPVYASPYTSRCATQNSGPSGSLLLSRRTLSFPASCRLSPAQRIGDFAFLPISQRPLQRNAMPLVLKRECTLRVKSKGILRLLCIVRGIVDCLREGVASENLELVRELAVQRK